MVEKGTLARDLRTEGRTQQPGILGCTLLTPWALNLTNLWQWGKNLKSVIYEKRKNKTQSRQKKEIIRKKGEPWPGSSFG